ncbi:hypothetical protein [Lelliottia wanjuensis]|uniref:Restriction endonuclease n=1 Tax=Lelliottia wanjuensis TaxID=3050585 RepID=A0AAP4FWM5_9ENTR|nr:MULTISPECIES: hypothetical protein [unclassified Lelliottia]MDK9356504.1 hypothetical protein [Lelliottia sp. V106_16]MDK9364072.1 hypothetical protein [Lelliottia sp. V106_12]MDK9375641.1 hypothetical protein [Lelliottia sp. V106_10]MDK9582667.1 hypothetical protein [Lelliottia sp. V86_10]MDK9602191.1 hypothetical protein [Lelliottia sp. V106_5]
MAGREDSLKAIFDTQFISACRHYERIEIRAPLNGLDQFFNADTLFSTFDKFFIIEFKSYKSSLRAENRKPTACQICCGLQVSSAIIPLHDACHFAMWGNIGDQLLYGMYDIYRNCVCNTSILPQCPGAAHFMLSPTPKNFNVLARLAGQNRAGLNSLEFQTYLEWLLGSRGGSGGGSGDFNAAIYATSSTHAVNGIPFKSREALHLWSQGNPPDRRVDDWDAPGF